MSFYVDLADNLADVIRAGKYSQPIDVRREYIASLEVKDIPDCAPWLVSVTPMGLTGAVGDRESLMQADYRFGVEFLARVRSTDKVELMDGFFNIIEQIQDQISSQPILAGGGYMVFPFSNDTAFNQSSALEQITFKNLTTVTYRISRGQNNG